MTTTRRRPPTQSPSPEIWELLRTSIAGLPDGLGLLDLEGRLRFRHRNGVADSARHPSSLVTYYGPKLVTVDGEVIGVKAAARRTVEAPVRAPSAAIASSVFPFPNGRGGRLPAGAFTHQEGQRWVF